MEHQPLTSPDEGLCLPGLVRQAPTGWAGRKVLARLLLSGLPPLPHDTTTHHGGLRQAVGRGESGLGMQRHVTLDGPHRDEDI